MFQIKVLQNSIPHKELSVRVCCSPKNGARRFYILICLKYYNALKLESKCTLGLKTVKNIDDNIDDIKKCSK